MQNPNHSTDSEFNIRNSITASFKYWWIYVILMVCGGLIGLFVNTLVPPKHEARFSFAFNIDYIETGYLTQYDEDQILGAAGTIVYSWQTIEKVQQTLAEQNTIISLDDLLNDSHIERRTETWTLKVIRPDQAEALKIAQFWAEQANQDLTSAAWHALILDDLNSERSNLQKCIENISDPQPLNTICNFSSIVEIQSRLSEVDNEIAFEKDASRGLISAVTFNLVEEPHLMAQPVRNGRIEMILGGTLIGLLLGFFGLDFFVRPFHKPHQ